MILLAGLAEAEKISLSEEIAGIIGLIILLLIVAAAVAMFVMTGMRGKQYEYLENMNIDTAYGVSGMAKERRSSYAETHSRLLVFGIMLCVISAIPMFMIMALNYHHDDGSAQALGTGLLLIMCAGIPMGIGIVAF